MALGSLKTTSLGNAGVSSLIKSASTLQSQISSFNDTEQRITFENNPSEENLQTYLAYLNGRVTSLQSTGSITDATKALSMSQDMNSAVSKSTTFQIQNESIQVMSGNATTQDKYNYITTAYQRAASIGDVTLAQSLESQAYSLSQTMQLQKTQAADAAATLGRASAGSQENVASNLTESLKQLNNDIQHSGQKNMNSTLQSWVKANTKTLEALGVKLPTGAQPNYFDLVNAVGGAIYNAHTLAYQAELPYNPQQAQTYMNKAVNLRMGIDKLPTLAGTLSAQQVQHAAQNGSQYAYDQATGKLLQTKQTGFNGYDENGEPLATYSGTIKQTTFLTPAQTTVMTKLGLNFSENKDKTTGNGVQVQATGNSPDWLKQVLGPNGVTNFFSTDKGLVFEADSGKGKSYYTLGTDTKGLVGLFENGVDGGVKALGGQYGFDQGSNTAVSSVIASAQATQHTIQLAQATQAASLKAAAPTVIPTINFAPTPATASLNTPTTAPIQAPKTVSVAQNAAGNIQNTAPGASISQSTGKGIKITGTTNAPVGMKI